MILSTAKNTRELRLCSRFHISISFQNYWTYYFFCIPEIKFSTIKEIFHNQGNFPQSNNFYIVSEIFQKEKHVLLLQKFVSIKEIFHN